MSLRVFILHGSFRPSRFAGTGEILLLDPDGEERAGVFGAADGGLGVEAEHRGRVQRVEPVGEGFLELPVVKRRSAGGTAAAGPITTDQVVLAAGMHCRHRYFGPSLAMTGNRRHARECTVTYLSALDLGGSYLAFCRNRR